MRGNYIKRYYLDDHKLAQRARLEFYRALHSDRMIAFVGAMGTEAFGYGDWNLLKTRFIKAAADTFDRSTFSSSDQIAIDAAQRARREIHALGKLINDNKIDAITGMSMIEEALTLPELRSARHIGPTDPSDPHQPWPLDQHDNMHEAMRATLAQAYRRPETNKQASPTPCSERFPPYDVPDALWRRLGIRRFATPSYDFEIERRVMLGDKSLYEGNGFADPFATLRALRDNYAERDRNKVAAINGAIRLHDDREMADKEAFHWDLGSGRIRRVYADGWAVESDMVNRERIDRMIEFAIGTDDVDAHIMHLHGRACNPRSMIVSRRDYDALYRRNDLNRAPFEFAKKMMMGGNPLLFVGLGMGEHELNHEMAEFISNAPYQRVAPTFLLWNAQGDLSDAEQRRAFRLEKLARFGVLTIFDTDLGLESEKEDPAVREQLGEKATKRSVELRNLAKVVNALAPNPKQSMLLNPTLRETHIGKQWRTMAGRLKNEGRPAILWGTTKAPKACDQDRLTKLTKLIAETPMLALVGPQGSGKGTISAAIAERAVNQPRDLRLTSADNCLIINGGFAFDTDTILDAIALFLRRIFAPTDAARDENGHPLSSRAAFFRSLNISAPTKDGPNCLIVINGLERFCGVDGEPLSAELDELLRMAVPKNAQPPTSGEYWKTRSDVPRVRFLFLGSARVRKYCDRLDCDIREFREFFTSCTQAVRPFIGPKEDIKSLPGGYLNEVWVFMVNRGITASHALIRAIDRYDANGATHVSGDLIDLRRELFSLIFDEENFRLLLGEADGPLSKEDATIGKLILRALAFIGAPVEDAVLRRMPALRRHAARVTIVREKLCNAFLVLELRGYQPDGTIFEKDDRPRYALHRSLLTEMRYRFGIPLNEAKLSTAFNMALYVAQPIDGDIPDSDIHDELGEAIDMLIGSYRHIPPEEKQSLMEDADEEVITKLGLVAEACGDSQQTDGQKDQTKLYALCAREYVQSLRGALAMIRGYYSTTGLLTLDSGDRLVSVERDGILLEHAERLDALIDAYGKITLARAKMRELINDKPVFGRLFGEAEPFYPDELVWMHNERGVVRLAMGDLYEARRSFDQAMQVNRLWVEADDTGHNWRRIQLNQLMVEMEMGEISRVERYCDEIERVTPFCPEQGHNDASDEDRRAMAIVHGHRGWCRQLRGDIVGAKALFESALKTFSDLGELRAQAWFGRLDASMRDEESTPDIRVARITAAQHLAQSARQMDIVHRIQVTLADAWLFGNRDRPPSQEMRQRANRMLEEALTYAIQADVHRVRLEASMTIARARLQTADYEGALRYAMDAMMIATRYGMELRKITLRAVIAQVMVARGHPVTAERLARTCIKMATRKRFQTAIGHAERVILDIPRVSSSISQSDGSGRRYF